MNEIQIAIPSEVLEATVKVLTVYQRRLEKEANMLPQDKTGDHRKLIEIVRRLVVFYSRTEGS